MPRYFPKKKDEKLWLSLDNTEDNLHEGRLSMLIAELRGRGTKAMIVRKTGLSYQALHKIQTGENIPLETTRRLIAQALGYPADYFLDSDSNLDRAVKRRLVVEVDFPPDFPTDDDNLKLIERAMIDAGNHIISTIEKMVKGKSK